MMLTGSYLSSQQWEVVIFIDDPLTAIDSWEKSLILREENAVWEAKSWRMCLIGYCRQQTATDTVTDTASVSRITIPDDAPIVSSGLKFWRDLGTIIRRALLQTIPDASEGLPYDFAVKKDSARYREAEQSPFAWASDTYGLGYSPEGIIRPKDIRSANSTGGDCYFRIRAEDFGNAPWPDVSSSSSIGMFWRRKYDTGYLQNLQGTLDKGEFDSAERMVLEPRYRLRTLDKLLQKCELYLYAYALSPTEASFPWIFYSHRTPQSASVRIVQMAFAAAGCRVYTSRNMQELLLWQREGVLPSDAQPQ